GAGPMAAPTATPRTSITAASAAVIRSDGRRGTRLANPGGGGGPALARSAADGDSELAAGPAAPGSPHAGGAAPAWSAGSAGFFGCSGFSGFSGVALIASLPIGRVLAHRSLLCA